MFINFCKYLDLATITHCVMIGTKNDSNLLDFNYLIE